MARPNEISAITFVSGSGPAKRRIAKLVEDRKLIPVEVERWPKRYMLPLAIVSAEAIRGGLRTRRWRQRKSMQENHLTFETLQDGARASDADSGSSDSGQMVCAVERYAPQGDIRHPEG